MPTTHETRDAHDSTETIAENFHRQEEEKKKKLRVIMTY